MSNQSRAEEIEILIAGVKRDAVHLTTLANL